jgi:hypothetical protein
MDEANQDRSREHCAVLCRQEEGVDYEGDTSEIGKEGGYGLDTAAI